MDDPRLAVITKAICLSRKFETGEGTCALMCMDQLGDVRSKGCSYHERIHAALAKQVAAALDKMEASNGV